MRSQLVLCLLLAACEEKKNDTAPVTSASTSAPPSASALPPPAAKPPFLSVDEKACHLGGDNVDLSAGDAKARVTAVLSTKPKVDGETLELQAMRDVKFSKMAALVLGAKAAKAKSVLVKTARRDNTMGELEISFTHTPVSACSAVANIGKDNSINVWPASGGTGEKFSKGMAGPDMTRGVAGVQKLAAGCDSNVWAVTADDTVQWGLVFDLATQAMGSFDGGKPMRANQLDVIESGVPGRKVL